LVGFFVAVSTQKKDFEEKWAELDIDGNYETALVEEIFSFVVYTEKLAFEHFILEHED